MLSGFMADPVKLKEKHVLGTIMGTEAGAH